MRKSTVTCTLTLLIGLLSCRETDTVEPNFPPVANAGADRAVESGAMVVIDASESSDVNKDSLIYSWSFIGKPANSQAVIEDPALRTTRFLADVEGSYMLRLTVTDLIDSDSDTVTFTSLKNNKAPTAVISNVPNGLDLGVSFVLSAQDSEDPDGEALGYLWEVVSAPEGSDMAPAAPDASTSNFTADRPGNYTIRLTVSDGTLTDQAQVEISTNVHTIANITPTSGTLGSTIKINGKNFSPEPEQNAVTVNGMVAVVVSASSESIVVEVPVGAGTGPVSVTVEETTVEGPVFTYVLSYVVSTVAEFDRPIFLAPAGNGDIFISDYESHVIRRLTANGQLTVVAGNGAAGWTDTKNPLEAQFRNPAGLVVDENGDLYVADNGNHVIRKILATGEVMTIAGVGQAGFGDGPAAQAVFDRPISVAIDHNNYLYIGDTGNHRVRAMSSQGNVFTFAGNGQSGFADGYGQAAQFNGIAGITYEDGYLYVADLQNHRIRRIDGQGLVTTFSGQGTSGFLNGNASIARFSFPYDVSPAGNGDLIVADYGNHSIRRVNANGGVTMVAGTNTPGMVDGPAALSRFDNPTGVCVSGDVIYVADFDNGRIRKMELK